MTSRRGLQSHACGRHCRPCSHPHHKPLPLFPAPSLAHSRLSLHTHAHMHARRDDDEEEPEKSSSSVMAASARRHRMAAPMTPHTAPGPRPSPLPPCPSSAAPPQLWQQQQQQQPLQPRPQPLLVPSAPAARRAKAGGATGELLVEEVELKDDDGPALGGVPGRAGGALKTAALLVRGAGGGPGPRRIHGTTHGHVHCNGHAQHCRPAAVAAAAATAHWPGVLSGACVRFLCFHAHHELLCCGRALLHVLGCLPSTRGTLTSSHDPVSVLQALVAFLLLDTTTGCREQQALNACTRLRETGACLPGLFRQGWAAGMGCRDGLQGWAAGRVAG